MALPGISSANEFYSAHYLESVLTGDIKKVCERWAEQARARQAADHAAGLSGAQAATPEVITSCQIKYTLKEALVGRSAAEIMELKLLEMAMGSAAYLNELVIQLAQAYLERCQQESGQSVPHDLYSTELQKVKTRLADQNVYGVDLNPVAVELAEVSLWFNSIFTPEHGRAFMP